MDKAYDIGGLTEMLKSKGMDVAEDAAKMAVECVFEWVSQSAQVSENKVDDIIAPLLPILKPHIMGMIDKIDGEEG